MTTELANPLFDRVRDRPLDDIGDKPLRLSFVPAVEAVFRDWYDQRFRNWVRIAALLLALFWTLRLMPLLVRVDPAVNGEVRLKLIAGISLVALCGWLTWALLKWSTVKLRHAHWLMLPGTFGVCVTVFGVSDPTLSGGDFTRAAMGVFQLALSLPLGFRMRFRSCAPLLVVSLSALMGAMALRQGVLDPRLTTQWGSALVFSLTVAWLLERDVRTDFVNRLTIHRLATTDSLTGALRRQAFVSAARAALEREGGVLVMLDVDHFKQINDTHGHRAGDAALTLLGSTLHRQLPEGALFGRLGGEEFAVVLPAADLAAGEQLAGVLRQCIEAMEVTDAKSPFRFTASLGVASGRQLETVLQHADEALYAAKDAGRNRVTTHGEQR